MLWSDRHGSESPLDRDAPALEDRAIEGADGSQCFALVVHLHEGEAQAAARRLARDEVRGCDGAAALEGSQQVGLRAREGDVSGCSRASASCASSRSAGGTTALTTFTICVRE